MRQLFINPRHTCAARATVVTLCVRFSFLECLFILKTISRTQQATKVKQFVWISLKPLCCRYTPLFLHCMALCAVGHFGNHVCALLVSIARVFSRIRTCMALRFCTLVHSVYTAIGSGSLSIVLTAHVKVYVYNCSMNIKFHVHVYITSDSWHSDGVWLCEGQGSVCEWSATHP